MAFLARADPGEISFRIWRFTEGFGESRRVCSGPFQWSHSRLRLFKMSLPTPISSSILSFLSSRVLVTFLSRFQLVDYSSVSDKDGLGIDILGNISMPNSSLSETDEQSTWLLFFVVVEKLPAWGLTFRLKIASRNSLVIQLQIPQRSAILFRKSNWRTNLSCAFEKRQFRVRCVLESNGTE